MRRLRQLYLVAITLATAWSVWAAVGERDRRATDAAAAQRAARLATAVLQEHAAAEAALARTRAIAAQTARLRPAGIAAERDLLAALSRARRTLVEVTNRPTGARVSLITRGREG